MLEQVIHASCMSAPPKQMLVVTGSGNRTCSHAHRRTRTAVTPPFHSVPTQMRPPASTARGCRAIENPEACPPRARAPSRSAAPSRPGGNFELVEAAHHAVRDVKHALIRRQAYTVGRDQAVSAAAPAHDPGAVWPRVVHGAEATILAVEVAERRKTRIRPCCRRRDRSGLVERLAIAGVIERRECPGAQLDTLNRAAPVLRRRVRRAGAPHPAPIPTHRRCCTHTARRRDRWPRRLVRHQAVRRSHVRPSGSTRVSVPRRISTSRIEPSAVMTGPSGTAAHP